MFNILDLLKFSNKAENWFGVKVLLTYFFNANIKSLIKCLGVVLTKPLQISFCKFHIEMKKLSLPISYFFKFLINTNQLKQTLITSPIPFFSKLGIIYKLRIFFSINSDYLIEIQSQLKKTIIHQIHMQMLLLVSVVKI